MDAGLKGGISETFQWFVRPMSSPRVGHCHGNPSLASGAKSLVQGHMAGKLCWAWTQDSAGRGGSQSLGDCGKEKGVGPAAHVLGQLGGWAGRFREAPWQESERCVGQDPRLPS